MTDRCWSAVALALVACHGPGKATQTQTQPPIPVAPVDAVPVAQQEPVAPPQTIHSIAPVPAPPSGGIVELAVSPDGQAALSADEGGELRLWPALDGSREPVAIDTPSATAIALAHTSDGFTAFFIDKADALVTTRLATDGTTRTRAIATAPAVEAFAMAEPGLVVLRRDQTVALYAPDGTTASRIAPLHGDHITAISAAGTHAAALVEHDGHAGIRVLALVPHLAWGDVAAITPVDRKLAVSPSGNRVAAVTRIPSERAHTTVVDLHGTTLYDDSANEPEAIAFVDDDTLVAAVHRELQWIDLRTRTPRKVALHGNARPVLGAAGGRAFTVALGDIAIVDASMAKFLGYALSAPRVVDQLGTGEILVASVSHLFTLDSNLELERDLSEQAFMHPIRDMRWLGGDDLVVITDQMSGATGDGMLYLANLARGQWTQLRTDLTASADLEFVPATGVVAVSGNPTELMRYRAASHSLAPITKTPRESPGHWDVLLAIPLDPALAGGARIAYRHDLYKSDSDPPSFREEHSLSWFAADTVRGKPLAKVTVDGMIGAFDAAGRAFVWAVAEHHPKSMTIVERGKPAREIAVDDAAPIWPDPRGGRFAMTYDSAVVVYSIDGTRQWSRAIDGAARAVWLRDGTLAVINDSGLALLDPTDGRVLAVRCGWQLSLTDDPHQTSYAPARPAPSMCSRLHP